MTDLEDLPIAAVAFRNHADTLDQSNAERNVMPGLLQSYRIFDLTTVISGPFATMLLLVQGADVIKVESVDDGDHVLGAPLHGEHTREILQDVGCTVVDLLRRATGDVVRVLD